MERVEVQLQVEVSRLLELAETADGQDCELDIPEELCHREERLARIDLPSNTVDFPV